ncbi:MAG: hypothetical protein K8R85_10585, partial [Bacteroidetes bacterium]|nr:hypothetical protein [Bacteroidota bacterium]
FTSDLIEKTNTIRSKTVIIAGWWYNEVMVEMIAKNKNNFVTFESYIDANKINKYVAEGFEIVYLPEQKLYNEQMFKSK